MTPPKLRYLSPALVAGTLSFACESAPPPAAAPGAPATAPPALQTFPLPARAAAPGPRFEAVDPAAAGLTFRHRWAPDARRAVDFGGAFSGGGVALGDADGDGRPDVLLTRPAGGPRLYRNLGDFRFEDVSAAAGLPESGWTTGAAFVDLNGDGAADLFVGHSDEPNAVYLNDGHGRFSAAPDALGLGATLATIAPYFADCDADGDLDAFVLTNRTASVAPVQGQLRIENGVPVVPEADRDRIAAFVRPDGQVVTANAGQQDRLYRNDAGRFVDITAESGLEGHDMGLGARFWDAEGDGLPDLYVANDFFGPDRVYLNTGGCVFRDAAPTMLPVTPWFSMGMDAGDLDGDGRLDLVGTDMAGLDHRQRVVSMGDQVDDAWFLTVGEPAQRMRNMVFLATGMPRMREAAQLMGLDATGWTWSVHLADLDQDGRVDAHFTNGMTRDFSDSDRRAALKAEGRWDRLALDTWMAAPPRAEPDRVYRNLGGLRFEDASTAWGLDAPGISYAAAFGDLDGDGDPDFVVNEFDAPPRLYRNRTADTHRVAVRLEAPPPNRVGVGAVVTLTAGGRRQVQDVALGAGFMSTHDTELLFGTGDATQVESLEIRWPNGRRERHGPFASDQRIVATLTPIAQDAAPALEPPAMFQAVRGFPPGAAKPAGEPLADLFGGQPLQPVDTQRLGPGLAVSDPGPGGALRVMVAGAPGRAAAVFEGTDHGFAPVAATTEPIQVGAEARFGVVGTGANAGVSTAPGAASHVFVLADFDGDGHQDAFVGGAATRDRAPEHAPNRLFVGDARGRLTDATRRLAPSVADACLAGDARFVDLDRDARPELIVACEWGPVRVWRNTPRGFEEVTAAWGFDAAQGVFRAVAAADLDADGDADLVVGNLGTNTPLQARADQPASLRFGNIADDGSFATVLGTVRAGVGEVPLATYDRLAARFPALVERAPTWAAFAGLGAGEVVSPARRIAERRLTVNTLETGWLRNDGGRFVFVPFPAEAQLGPSAAVVVQDFDADGHADVFVGQNSERYAPMLGPTAGGVSVLLRGLGGGAFEAVAPRLSGLLIDAAVEAAVAVDADRDGRPDLLVALHDGPPLTFLNATGRPFRTVSAHAARGDGARRPARVETEAADGTRRVFWPGAESGGRAQPGAAFQLPVGAAPWVRVHAFPVGGGAPVVAEAGEGPLRVALP